MIILFIINLNNLSNIMEEQAIKELLKSKKKIIWKKLPKEILEFLENKYPGEFKSYSETWYRILNNIDILPKCQTCGKPVNFIRFELGYSKHCSHKCALLDKNVQEKLQNTVKEKYGVKCIFHLDRVKKLAHSEEAYNKHRLTSLLNCGYTHYMKSPEKQIERINKLKETKGVINVFQLEEVKNKCKNTWIKNYGVDHPMKSDIVKQHLEEKMLLKYGVINAYNKEENKIKAASKESQLKIHNSKKKNGSYGRSKLELEMFNLLKEVFPDIIFQYYDKDRYPFTCDFYIPSKDIFIECQGTLQHGKHPFNEYDENDKQILTELINRSNKYSTNKNQYTNAINIWTKRDPMKRKTAKENNIKLIEFWNINDCKQWLKENGG